MNGQIFTQFCFYIDILFKFYRDIIYLVDGHKHKTSHVKFLYSSDNKKIIQKCQYYIYLS